MRNICRRNEKELAVLIPDGKRGSTRTKKSKVALRFLKKSKVHHRDLHTRARNLTRSHLTRSPIGLHSSSQDWSKSEEISTVMDLWTLQGILVPRGSVLHIRAFLASQHIQFYNTASQLDLLELHRGQAL